MEHNKFQNFVSFVAKWGILLVFGGILAALFVASVLTTSTVYGRNEVIDYNWDFPVKHIITIGCVLCVGVFIRYKNLYRLFDNRVINFAVLCVIGGYAVFILCTQLDLISDQKNCFEAAAQFLEGNYAAWKPDGYAGRYPNQNGLILFFALVQFLFGKGNHLIVQFINLIAAVTTAVFAAKICELAFKIENKKLVMLLHLLFAPMMLYITFTYGTMIGLALSTVGMYFQMRYLKGSKVLYAVLSVFCFAFAVLFKSNYLIVLVASILVYGFYAIYHKKILNIVLAVAVACVYAFSSSAVTSFIEEKADLEISKGVPTVAWITMGISECNKGPGWWSGYNNNLYVNSEFDTEKAHEKGVKDLKERVKYMSEDPVYTLKFFAKKILSMWCEPTFQSIWIQQVKEHPFDFSKPIFSFLISYEPLNSVYWQVCDIAQTMIYFFAIVYLVLNFRKIKVFQLLPGIVMIGGFLFHLIWEAKGQYAVVYFFLLIPYAVCGFYGITKKITEKLSKAPNNKQIVE